MGRASRPHYNPARPAWARPAALRIRLLGAVVSENRRAVHTGIIVINYQRKGGDYTAMGGVVVREVSGAGAGADLVVLSVNECVSVCCCDCCCLRTLTAYCRSA